MISMRSKVMQKVLRYFFTNEDAKVYLNELSAIIEEDVSNLHKILVKLEKEGLLKSEYRGKERFFSLNKSYSLLSAYREIFLKNYGIAEVLKSIISNIDGIDKALIYGSFVNAGFDEFSDIDLLLIGDLKRSEISKRISRLEKQLGREINYVIYSNEEYNKKKNSDPFLKKILSNKIINLA